jgi:hypothetical protein
MLIIVDVQDRFLTQSVQGTEDSDFWDAVEKNVRRARKNNEPIVTLKFYRYGGQSRRLLNMLKGYDNHHSYYKHERNGAPKIPWAKFKPEKITVIGGFLEWCLLETVVGLREQPRHTKEADITVDMAASYYYYVESERERAYSIKKLRRHKIRMKNLRKTGLG